MPELPEVECTRRSIEPSLTARQIIGVRRGPHQVVMGEADEDALLVGRIVRGIDRLGKEMAILVAPASHDHAVGRSARSIMPTKAAATSIADEAGAAADQRCVVVHLGMTGSLQHHAGSSTSLGDLDAGHDPHVHLQWLLDDGSRLVFRDPRRFGGVWTYPSLTALYNARWRQRGPDALRATPAALHQRLSRTTRAVKAALLDQSVVAGLGNIYVDELLFGARIHPLTPACQINRGGAATLARRMRTLLERSIKAGGSTLRDYADGLGRAGAYQQAHRVYGRAGLPCRRCGTLLTPLMVAGRTTVCCEECQPVGTSQGRA